MSRIIFEKMGYGLNTLQEIPNSEVLIRAVDGITVQTKAHKNGLAF